MHWCRCCRRVSRDARASFHVFRHSDFVVMVAAKLWSNPKWCALSVGCVVVVVILVHCVYMCVCLYSSGPRSWEIACHIKPWPTQRHSSTSHTILSPYGLLRFYFCWDETIQGRMAWLVAGWCVCVDMLSSPTLEAASDTQTKIDISPPAHFCPGCPTSVSRTSATWVACTTRTIVVRTKDERVALRAVMSYINTSSR